MTLRNLVATFTVAAVAVLSPTLPLLAQNTAGGEPAQAQTAQTTQSTNPPPKAISAGQEAQSAGPREGQVVATQNSEAPRAYWTYKTPYEFWLTAMTVAIMAVTILALCLMAGRAAITPEFTRTFIIIVVVFASLFLISAGYSDKQAAPVYSLLGTIVGYIFGRMTGEARAGSAPEPAPETPGANKRDEAKFPR